MEEIITKQLLEGVTEFLSYVNWIFVIALLLISWVITNKTKSTISHKKSGKKKIIISTKWKVLITGVLLACIFLAIYPPLRTSEEIGKLFFGIFTSVGIHKIGLNKFLRSK